jgi:hypothetical protein
MFRRLLLAFFLLFTTLFHTAPLVEAGFIKSVAKTGVKIAARVALKKGAQKVIQKGAQKNCEKLKRSWCRWLWKAQGTQPPILKP